MICWRVARSLRRNVEVFIWVLHRFVWYPSGTVFKALHLFGGVREKTSTRPVNLPFRFGLPERPSPGHRLQVGGCVGLSAAGGSGLVHGVLSVVAFTPKPQDNVAL